MKQILVLDQSGKVMRAMRSCPDAAREDCLEVADLDEVDRRLAEHPVDAIILGKLPRDVARADACARIRRSARARRVLLLVAVPRSAPRTRARCFEEGADAVIDEPVSGDAIVALLGERRRRFDHRRTMLAFGDLVMRPEERKVSARGLPLALTPAAYGLLHIFLENPRQTLSRHELIDRLGRGGITSGRTIDSLVRRVRAALSEVGFPDPFVAVPRVGYSLGMPH
jgi:DNA-binding response OmpR family regulator